MNYELDLAINYQTFDNFKQKGALILQGLFAGGRMLDYAKFSTYAIITPLNERNNKINVEEQDRFNRAKTNCLIYDLTYNKWNPGKYNKLFIYYSITSRDTGWYGYVLYNTETGKTFNKYCIDYSDDKLYQYIYRNIIDLANDKKWEYFSCRFDALKNKDIKNVKTIKDYNEMKKYYEDFIKLPFNPLQTFTED